jgi:hypothetical protein
MLVTEEMRRRMMMRLLKLMINELGKAVIRRMKLFILKKTIRKKFSLKCKVINQVRITGRSLLNLGKHFKISMLIQIRL